MRKEQKRDTQREIESEESYLSLSVCAVESLSLSPHVQALPIPVLGIRATCQGCQFAPNPLKKNTCLAESLLIKEGQ